MKTYLKIVILVVAVASVCYWNSISVTGQAESLVLQNIEALADQEFPLGNSDCIGSGSLDCPMKHLKVKYVIQGRSLEE